MGSVLQMFRHRSYKADSFPKEPPIRVRSQGVEEAAARISAGAGRDLGSRSLSVGWCVGGGSSRSHDGGRSVSATRTSCSTSAPKAIAASRASRSSRSFPSLLQYLCATVQPGSIYFGFVFSLPSFSPIWLYFGYFHRLRK